jgi:RimJ/RimL family protein N-acetyltransferase
MRNRIFMKPSNYWRFARTRIFLRWVNWFIWFWSKKQGRVGIVIQGHDNRKKYWFWSIILIQYSFNNLNLHQLYANIGTENEASKAFLLNLAWMYRYKERLESCERCL